MKVMEVVRTENWNKQSNISISDGNTSKGYGFVHFESDEAATRAIEKVIFLAFVRYLKSIVGQWYDVGR